MVPPQPPCDVSVVILSRENGAARKTLLEKLSLILKELHIRGQILFPEREGFGLILLDGLRRAEGLYVVTLDAEMDDPFSILRNLWKNRSQGDIVIASRYLPGSVFASSLGRKFTSQLFNRFVSRALSLPVRDVSSSFRIYRREILEGISLESSSYDVLAELLVKCYCQGYRIAEIPFSYFPRPRSWIPASPLLTAWAYGKTLYKLWVLRCSIASADYDERAHRSIIPLQRYWQRRRHKILAAWAANIRGPSLDVGCGSSRLILDLPQTIGLDVSLEKLRYLQPRHGALVQGSIFELPFADKSFDGVICSQAADIRSAGNEFKKE